MSKSNDDRSNSLNPNNSAYAASESNRAWQLGLEDDDCEETKKHRKDREEEEWLMFQQNNNQ